MTPERVIALVFVLVPAPLRRPIFRWLWAGWSISYAGDALQVLAQTWLIAVLTNSALAVAGSPVISGLPLLLLPLGGVIADAYDRRRLLLVGQLVGAATTTAITVLVATHRIAIWEIYTWAVVNGLVRLVARPAYKALLTESVPVDEARSAMAVTSMTETGSLVGVTALGALLLGVAGLTTGFVVNTLTYVVAAAILWRLRNAALPTVAVSARMTMSRALFEVREGLSYLRRTTALLHPLALTLLLTLATSPVITLLAAVVHEQGESLVDLGLLSAAATVGTFAGAAYAGASRPKLDPGELYAWLGVFAALALAAFALLPVGYVSMAPLAAIGLVYGIQTVWNASRVAEVGAPAYQGRLQAITTMALSLGSTVGALWAGPVLDTVGVRGLLGAAAALLTVSLASALAFARRAEPRRRLSGLRP
jgi:MFS family permease